MPPESDTQTPAAEPTPETPKPTPFEARLAELRKPETPTPSDTDTPAAEVPADSAAESVPEAGAPSGELEPAEGGESEVSPGAAPAEHPGGATALVAKLPGQRAGDPELEIPIDDELREVLTRKGIDPEQFAERTRQATNGVMRRRDYEAAREEIAADRAELQSVEDALRSDPAGWMVGHIPEPLRQATAREILLSLSPEGWEAVMDDVAGWDKDPGARATAATARENARLKAKDATRSQQDERTTDQKQAAAIGEAIGGLIPEDLDDARADRLFDYAVDRLRKHVAQNKLKRLDPGEVPQLLADLKVFEDFGVTPASAGAAPLAKPATSPAAARPSGPAGKGKEPSPTREQVQKRVETRRAAAATAPAGAGAGIAGSAPPKGQTFEQRLAWLRGRK